MNDSKKTLEFRFERTIEAAPEEVFDGWLDPKVPGNPWNMAEKLLLNPRVDGFFYWLIKGNAHYRRFTDVERPGRIQHTWMSRSTLGEESMCLACISCSRRGSWPPLIAQDSRIAPEARQYPKANRHQV